MYTAAHPNSTVLCLLLREIHTSNLFKQFQILYTEDQVEGTVNDRPLLLA